MGHYTCFSWKCRSWKRDEVALEVQPALLGLLLQHRGSLRLTGCHYLSSKCWFG